MIETFQPRSANAERHPLRLRQAFLVGEEDGLTLIDTTIGEGGAGAILAAAARMEMPIVRIALTHAHGDHVGGLDHLAPALPDAEC